MLSTGSAGGGRVATWSRRLLIALTASALGWAVLSAAPAQAAAPSIDSVTYATPSMAVSGLMLGAQTISAHIVDDADSTNTFALFLTSTGGVGGINSATAYVSLTSGTDHDGSFTGILNLPSTADGRWSITGFGPPPPDFDGDITPPPVYPIGGLPTFTLAGTHQPVMIVTPPAPAPATGATVSVRVRLTDRDTGKPIAGAVFGRNSDTGCINGPRDGWINLTQTTRTNRVGDAVISSRLDSNSLTLLQCFAVLATGQHTAFTNLTGFFITVRTVLWLHLVSSHARAGHNLPITGSVVGSYRVELQRLVGRSAWRTVCHENARTSGRFTLTATPRHGRNTYRVYSPPGDLATSTRPFTITGV